MESKNQWSLDQKNPVRTNEIVRRSTSLPTVKFVHLHSSIRTFLSGFSTKMLLGYTVAKACASSGNSTWFTRLFLLVRGWGLGMRLGFSPVP